MRALDKVLPERVDQLATFHRSRRPFLSTMGTQAAIAELIERNEEVELAIRRLAVEVERIAALQEGGESTRSLERAPNH